MGINHWVVCSSSSGKTFENIYSKLETTLQNSCLGLHSDRDCQAVSISKSLLGDNKVFQWGRKKEFEDNFLQSIEPYANDTGLVFLCGFFGILSEEFLNRCPWPIVNTHPSLLPAFPGLDEKVHQEAFAQAHYSGFSFHMVNEKLDGGPILFQKPVDIRAAQSWEEARQLVRSEESACLPGLLSKLLSLTLNAEDRHLNTRELLLKLQL